MQRTGKLIQQCNFRVLRNMADKYHFSYSEFIKCIQQAIDTADYAIFETYMHQLVLKISIDYSLSIEKSNYLSSVFDNCYIMLASKQFLVDYKDLCVLHIPDPWELDFNVLNTIEDFTIDLHDNGVYLPFMIKICKASYKVNTSRYKDLEFYNVSVLTYDQSRQSIGCLYTFSFCKELRNRIFVESDTDFNINRCCNCSNYTKFSMIIDQGIVVPVEMCMVSKKKFETSRCSICDLVITPIEILNTVFHIVEMYANRKNILRKNGLYSKKYKKHKVHVVKQETDATNETVLNLKQYYDYEQTKKPWQGGHHRSPVEHERREHVRIYRNSDGSVKKVVTVKATTVNKAGNKPVYKIGG